ncbi:nucleotidyltransferase domain-containing protein [bacterium]|nr:nucleotidyltransferase domain-containing protein [bacterium]
MLLDRKTVIGRLAGAFEAQPWVLALWEGGSASFGRADEYSDIDLQCFVAAGQVEAAFSFLESLLEELGGIALRYRVPEPAWHGQSQCFYQLRQASPFHMLDMVFIQAGADFKLTERELHGEPQILFDKAGLIKATSLDMPSHLETLRARVESLAVTFPLFQPLVQKEVLRGRALDALGFYQAFTIRPLVEVLRIIHDPEKYNFNLRYLEFYLPADVVRRLEGLAFTASLAELAQKQEQAAAWFAELLPLARESVSGRQTGV